MTKWWLLGYFITNCTRLSSEKDEKKDRGKQESKAVSPSVTYKVS